MLNNQADYDYVIAGGGSAGCAAAARLVNRYGARVLLLEGGDMDTNPLIHMPAGSFKIVFGDSDHMVRHISEPQAALDGRRVALPQANVLGGGSSVNAMAYLRGSPSDYSKWSAEVGDEWGWNWPGLLPYFRAQECNVKFNDDYHGVDGPLRVNDPAYKVESSDLFIKTMQNQGVPFRSDFNGPEKFGVGYIQVNSHAGRRCSAVDAFLRPLLKANSPKLTLVTRASVQRILFEGNRAVGCEYLVNGRLKQVRAASEVLITAGSMRSPKLLMLSGIGPAAQLTKHGIKVRSDLPGVGQNFQDHVMTPVSAYTRDTNGYFGEDAGWRALRNYLQYRLFESGPILSNGAETQAFVRIDGAAAPDDPNVQIYSVGLLWPGAPGAKPAHGITLLANLVRPHSRGELRLRSADPKDDLLFEPNYLGDERDLNALIASVRLMRSTLQTHPLSEKVLEEVMPGPSCSSDAELAAYVKRSVETDYHPVGTCKMGRDSDPMSVLTPDLRVRGVECLRVLDASMMPHILSANLNATVTAVAEKAVDMMCGGSG